jgi:D-alanyl-lipoteichoic acid acyltransferase DltB (MBOAT superfamily)
MGIVIPLFFLLPQKGKKIHLLISSYIFYGYWDWRFCSLIMMSTLIDYTVGLKLYKTKDQKKRKRFLLVSIFSNLGFLAFFKYFNFFSTSFEAILTKFGIEASFVTLNVLLPVGISFYTFQTMSYTIDIYRNKLKPTSSLLDFSLFVAFFPQLVAGPIERAVNLLPQIKDLKLPTKFQIHQGIVLITIGLFRKVILGDSTGRIVDHIFGQMEYYSSFELIVGLLLFYIQIYADFSGYSHIARGTAKLLGVEIMKNFEQPYFSPNITEFWRRWHISLSSWLRDYLYIPLGGNRKGKIRTYINQLITMLLGGLWHGASWNFVIWGGLHGIFLAIHKLICKRKIISENYVYQGIKSLLVFLVKVLCTNILILFTWLFFRLQSFSDTATYFKKLFFWESGTNNNILLSIVLSYIGISFLLDFFEYKTGSHSYLLRLKPAISAGIAAGMMIVPIAYLFYKQPLPFIYFQF